MADLVGLVNLPSEDGVVKMVQVLRGEKRESRVLVLGSERIITGCEFESHADILRNYLDSQNIAWEPDPDDTHKPDKRGKEYFLSGAGKARVDVGNRTITLFDKSVGYQVMPDKGRYRGSATDPDGWNLQF